MSIKIAGVQMGIEFANIQANLDRVIAKLRETVAAGAKLTVFPECTFPGSAIPAWKKLESSPSQWTGQR